jgi:hypothetical protein
MTERTCSVSSETRGGNPVFPDYLPERRHELMPPEDPGYLNTSDRTGTPGESLQDTAGTVTFTGQNRTGEIVQLLDIVRDRRP